MQAAGLSLNACARALTEKGISTPTGKAKWASQTVINLLARVPEPQAAPLASGIRRTEP